MDIFSVPLVLCITAALIVSAQQTGTLPSTDKKSSEDNNKFMPITQSPKFSIGLGVLSPSYSQKFGNDGKIKLDFNQDSGGYSYSLNNLVHPLVKPTDRSGSDTDKKYSTDTLKAADASHQLTSGAQFSPSSYSLSVSSGSRSDSVSSGVGYPQTQVNSVYGQGSQVGAPIPQNYGQHYAHNYGPSYGPPSYSPVPNYGPPAYAPTPYQSYPNSGSQYNYSPTTLAPVATSLQSTPPQIPYGSAPTTSASAQQPYPSAPPQQPYPAPQPQYNPYGGQMASPYGYGAPPMSPYGMYAQPAPQPYGYGSQYGAGGGGGYGMYGSPSQASPSSYPYSGGSGDPLANLSPQDINTLRQLYGASSSLSMSYMSPYSGMGGMGGGSGMGGMGGGYGAGSGGYGSYGSGSGSSGGLSSLISLFG